MSTTAAALDAEIQKQSAAFAASCLRLSSVLGAFMPKPGAEDIFISSAYEFGVEHTLERAMKDADYFELPAPLDKDGARQLSHPLQEANRLHNAIIDAVAERETLLLKNDPARLPTYFWMGREFTINPKEHTVTYKDTGEVKPYMFVEKTAGKTSPSGKERSR
jgi:hypothetical protein